MMNTLQELQDQLDKVGRNCGQLAFALLIVGFALLLGSGYCVLTISAQDRVIETLEARVRVLELTAQYPLLQGDDPRDLTSYAIPMSGQALVVNMSHNTTITTPFLWATNVGDAMVYLIDSDAYPYMQLDHSTATKSWKYQYDISQGRGRYLVTDSRDSILIRYQVPLNNGVGDIGGTSVLSQEGPK